MPKGDPLTIVNVGIQQGGLKYSGAGLLHPAMYLSLSYIVTSF